MAKVHELRCWRPVFEAKLDGRKPWEWRKDDRGFEVGDTLREREWDYDTETYTGREILETVTHIVCGPDFGIPMGYVIMTTKPIAPTPAGAPAVGPLEQKVRDYFANVSDEEFLRGVKEAGFELRPLPAPAADDIERQVRAAYWEASMAALHTAACDQRLRAIIMEHYEDPEWVDAAAEANAAPDMCPHCGDNCCCPPPESVHLPAPAASAPICSKCGRNDGWSVNENPYCQWCGRMQSYQPAPAAGAATPDADDKRLVTVCAECLQASCWQGIFMCGAAQNADTLDVPVYELRRLGREHPDYWKSECKNPAPAAGAAKPGVADIIHISEELGLYDDEAAATPGDWAEETILSVLEDWALPVNIDNLAKEIAAALARGGKADE